MSATKESIVNEINALPEPASIVLSDLLYSKSNRIIQAPSSEANRLSRLAIAFSNLNRTEAPPNPHNPIDLIKKLRYSLTHGGEPNLWSTITSIDCTDLQDGDEKIPLEGKLLLKIQKQFSELNPRDIPKLKDQVGQPPITMVLDFLHALKKNTKVRKQTLIMQNFDTLSQKEQANISKLLLEQLTDNTDLNVIIFHEEPISLGVDSDEGYAKVEILDSHK